MALFNAYLACWLSCIFVHVKKVTKDFADVLIYILWGFQFHFKGLKKKKESYICQSSSRLIESVKFFDKLS